MHRRELLLHLLGLGCAGALAPHASRGADASTPPPFPNLPLPLPLLNDGLSGEQQRQRLGRVTIEDRLRLPPGFTADVIAVWGDPLANGRFGFNNDYLAFFPQGKNRALLAINFEYISFRPWREGLAEVLPQAPPVAAVIKALAERDGRVDVTSLSPADPLMAMVKAVATAAMEDLGIGVTSLRRRDDGRWTREPGPNDRRLSGLSGINDSALRLRCSGPAANVFRRPQRLGFDDGLGDRIIGTFANCAGGTTPWGTLLSAEENIQDQVVEAVHADGSSPSPSALPFRCDEERLSGLRNPFGLAGNKYGWMVEVDPSRPEQPAVKHTWLGRFRHEAVAVRAIAGEPLRVYSACDRHGGHLYRFVSDGVVADPSDPSNSKLLEAGRLEVARLDPAGPDGRGRGRWLPLTPSTPVNPDPPSRVEAFGLRQPTVVPHSDRRRAGAEALRNDEAVAAYRERYRTLADLYPGPAEEQMGAILIDAHLAANAIGATAGARPEDTELDPNSGALLIAFTAAGTDGEGSADPAIFRGPNGETNWPYGWLMRLEEGTEGFHWHMVASGGTPWQGGLGFANPDNLAFDRSGNLWMLTDRASTAASTDVFGNNSCWLFPASGPLRGKALPFATGPMECELTGLCLESPAAGGQETTLFLGVQHPGEAHGTHRRGAEEIQSHQLVDRDGVAFEQLRTVPLGSNWPSGVPGRSPRPGVVAIRRMEGGPLLQS
jgi:secreted PhoX family phosphatase